MSINDILKYITGFIFLVLIQSLVLNNVHITPLNVSPYFYVLFILILPFQTSKWFLLISAFFLGFSIDIFSDTLGLHSSASVFAAFFRPAIILGLAPREGYDIKSQPIISSLGIAWFVKYAFVVTLIHHFAFYFVDAFRFSHLIYLFAKIIITTLFSVFLIIVSQYIIFKK